MHIYIIRHIIYVNIHHHIYNYITKYIMITTSINSPFGFAGAAEPSGSGTGSDTKGPKQQTWLGDNWNSTHDTLW